jgi:penicillin-binding protein 2
LVAIFAALVLSFAVVVANLAVLATDQDNAQAARSQSEITLTLSNGRGNIYDCNFTPLTGAQTQTYALIAPGRTGYHTMFNAIPASLRTEFYQKIVSGVPFLMQVENTSGIDAAYLFAKPRRYYTFAIAPHIIGYVNSSGEGISGVEYAYNSLLEGGSTTVQVQCVTTAQGGFAVGYSPTVLSTQGSGNGVMLTLDAGIQRICEAIAAQYIGQGSIVVLECATGRVRASVSMPMFDPQDIAASIQKQDTSLVNRSVSAFSVGSVFKPILAAAALEQGALAQMRYVCDGSISVNGHVYRCAYSKGHGEVTLQSALEVSCNCYFVQLGLALGGEAVYNMAAACGFGESTPLAGTLRTASGNLPTVQTLANLGQLATLSFGQGALTATPVQVAAAINVFANEGRYIAPTFVEGIVNEYTQTVTQSLYAPVQRQAVSAQTAQQIKDMLVSVVEQGLGSAAQPIKGGAGGKTGTAQTGRTNSDGEELYDAWFAGFFPADEPQYTVAVLLDGDTHGSEEAAEIFAAVANALYFYTLPTDEA